MTELGWKETMGGRLMERSATTPIPVGERSVAQVVTFTAPLAVTAEGSSYEYRVQCA
jgi:hypothetical protein